MYRETLTLGVVPNKRSFLSMVEAKRQKDCFMEEIRKIKASIVEIVDIDDICENGIVCEMDKVNAIVDKMKNRKIDALFFPFCDFGEEQVVAAIASKFTVPILIWGPRDERPNTDEARGNIPLVLHGCSDIPEEQMKEAVNLGMSKFNIATEYFRTMYQSIEKRINNQEFEGNGVKLMYDIKEEMIDFVIQKIRLLNPNKYSM